MPPCTHRSGTETQQHLDYNMLRGSGAVCINVQCFPYTEPLKNDSPLRFIGPRMLALMQLIGLWLRRLTKTENTNTIKKNQYIFKYSNEKWPQANLRNTTTTKSADAAGLMQS